MLSRNLDSLRLNLIGDAMRHKSDRKWASASAHWITEGGES